MTEKRNFNLQTTSSACRRATDPSRLPLLPVKAKPQKTGSTRKAETSRTRQLRARWKTYSRTAFSGCSLWPSANAGALLEEWIIEVWRRLSSGLLRIKAEREWVESQIRRMIHWRWCVSRENGERKWEIEKWDQVRWGERWIEVISSVFSLSYQN